MQAIREIKKVKDHQVIITLPPSFETEEVEVIVFPVPAKIKKPPEKKETLQEFLLHGPTWSKEEVKSFEKTIRERYK